MVTVYNSRSALLMEQGVADNILNLGGEALLNFYKTGVLYLGPNNRGAVDRVANFGTIITENNLPLPPSLITEFFADRTTRKSKQDYRIILDGDPGSGKSTTFFYKGARYGEEMAYRAIENPKAPWIIGEDPFDYFSIKNCCLLQDTEGLTNILDNCEKRQAIIVDDAGVTVGSKDSQTQKNKNIGAIMQTCRTKRLLLLWNAPMRKHIDLQIRELVYAKGHIFKSCHAAGFNIIKINITKQDVTNPNAPEWKHRFVFNGKKMSFYIAFSPDFIDTYEGVLAKYEAGRDVAADALIHGRSIQEHVRNNPVDKAKEIWKDKMRKYFNFVLEKCKEAEANKTKLKRTEILTHCPDLTERDVIRMIAMYNSGEYQKEGKNT
jgi:hypothetical protein